MPRLLYLVSEDWYFLSHRLPMARAAHRAGYEVHVATRVASGGPAILDEGFKLHPLSWRRGSIQPLDVIRAVAEVRRLYRTLEPDLVHQVSLWPAVIGSFAALGLPVVRLSAIAGLGFVFASDSPKARLIRGLLNGGLRFLLAGRNGAVLVQNSDDRDMLGSMGVPETRLFLIPGSGVDTAQLLPLPEPDAPITMAYTGRLLEIKGLRTLADAQEQLARAGTPVRLLIAGEPDPSNPAPISADEIERWRRRDGITLLGHVKDIREVWAAAHIAVQASYGGEGLPKSLLEAAACGRPIVATDVPGCRQIARDGVNAVLVPPRDASALSSAIARLAGDAGLRSRFGAASRKIVEQEFSAERIGREIVALYGVLLARGEAKDMAGARS